MGVKNNKPTRTITHSFKWVFLTTIVRRALSFLLFLYIVRVFSRAEIGSYRTFFLILSFSTLISSFSFNFLNIVEKTKKYIKVGMQFVLISSVFISIILFLLRGILSEKYGSFDLYMYILYGFWLVIPLTFKKIIRSLYELDMDFKFLSITETIKVIFYVLLALLLFLIDLKYYYFIIAFFLGEIVELVILYYPIRKKLAMALLGSLKLKFLKPLNRVLKEKFSFLCFSTIPTALNLFVSEAPILLMGLFFLPEFIGNYFVAAQLVTVPVSFLTISLSQILFPAFSLTEKEHLPQKIDEYIKHVVFVLWIPILILGVLLKHWSFLIIGNHEINLVISIVSLLTLKTLIVMILNPLSSIPTVFKKPQYELYWSICYMTAVCGMILLFRNFSFLNMIYLYVTVSILSLIAFIVMILKMVDLPIKNFVFSLWKGTVYTFPLISLLFLPQTVKTTTSMLFLLLSILYSVTMLYIFERKFFIVFFKRMLLS